MQLLCTNDLRQLLFPGRAQPAWLIWNFSRPTFLENIARAAFLDLRQGGLIQESSHEDGFGHPLGKRLRFDSPCQNIRQPNGQSFHVKTVRQLRRPRKTI